MYYSDTMSITAGDRVERRLAAILVADVAGYSRLMHTEEEATHARVTALLTNTVMPAIAEHGGRVVKHTGDGLLADFPSAVDAVRAAMVFQDSVYKLSIDDAQDKRILFRVGINIGDVIVDAHDIFGDGVNIASRLEGIAQAGGICLSSSAHDQVYGKIGIEFADLGEQSLKNISRPVRAYAVIPDGSDSVTQIGIVTPQPLSAPRLSIVVLPFVNIGDDPEQDYFVDGVTESLTTDLSRIHGSFVIARNTAFAYKGHLPDARQIGRELNVRYVLEGSVQRDGNRLRINVQLIDAETCIHLWAERFDKPVTNLLDIQDEIVSRLANTLDSELIAAEAQRASRSPHPDAMDLYFQGRACWNKGMTPEYLAQARNFYDRALTLDPRNVDAMVGMATLVATIAGSFASDDRAAQLAAAETMLNSALSMDPHYAGAHLAMGAVLMFTNRANQANRNFPLAHFHLAEALALLGQLDDARAAAQAGLALDPGFNLRRYRVNALSDNPVYLAGRERSCQGMRMAGVPEE